MSLLSSYVQKVGGYHYLVFRVVVGLLFFLHGWMKFAGGMAKGMMLWAAVIEVVVGAALVLGLFTRVAGLLGAVEMVVAFVIGHTPKGWNPMTNGGELAVLFFVAFLVVMYQGNGRWSLENTLLHKEVF